MWTPIVIALSFALTFSANAQDATSSGGLEGGNDFQYLSAVGNVSVQCIASGRPPTGPSTAYYRCEGYSFSPATEARFIGPSVDADEVSLKATHGDGSTRSKSGSYDGRKGRSDDRFNLWTASLFQRPLLNFGKNKIDWVLTRKSKTVERGQFVATVKDNGTLHCPATSTTSLDTNDCINSNQICRIYFNRYGHLCK